jgi:hypothetical protein
MLASAHLLAPEIDRLGCYGAAPMTKPVNRPHKKPGRKRKNAPPSAAERVEALAASGHSIVGIARGLNTSKERLHRWMNEDPALAEALARGRESERFVLHNSLYRAAVKGNVIAAMFLLKARHGYREGDQSEQANKVSITFALPGSMNADQYKVIDHEPPALPLPDARPRRS